MSAKKKSDSFQVVEALMEPIKVLPEVKAQSTDSYRRKISPISIPKVIVAGVEIELTKLDHNPQITDTYINDREKLNGYYGYRQYQEFIQSRKTPVWYYAIVNEVKVFIAQGSLIEVNDLGINWDPDGPSRSHGATLILNGGEVTGGSIWISGKVNLLNVRMETIQSLTITDSEIKHSNVQAEHGHIKSSEMNGGTVRVKQIKIEHGAIYDATIQLNGEFILTRAHINTCDFSSNMRDTMLGLHITQNVSRFNINLNFDGLTAFIGHRSHYGYIQGISSQPFICVIENAWRKNLVGMAISDKFFTVEEIIKSDSNIHPWSSGQPKSKVDLLCEQLFNQKLDLTYCENPVRTIPFASSIITQIEDVRRQLKSKLELWDLIQSLRD